LIIGGKHLRKAQIEKGYKIQTTPVIKVPDDVGGYRRANILVENIGKGKITCAAKLTKITMKELNGSKRIEIDVNVINPYGRFLKWESSYSATSNDYAVLNEGIPVSIELLGSHRESYIFSDSMKFLFADGSSTPPIPFGDYMITVEFLRWTGTRYIKLHTFEETLKSSHDLIWMNSGNNGKTKEAIKGKHRKKEVFFSELPESLEKGYLP